MEDDLAAMQGRGQALGVIRNVHLRQPCVGIEMRPEPSREVVDHYHVVTALHEGVDKVGSNEARSTCDRYFHTSTRSDVATPCASGIPRRRAIAISYRLAACRATTARRN